MVVLAASIVTKSGKPLVSRQFREMPRSRIEGLLTSFPKLISSNTQHTTVETETVRYVYQPLETLYMVVITNKGSNIVQDIETLHLFARVVGDLCRSQEEKEITKNSFELIFAFDEIVSLGYRENVNLQQIRTIIEMDSHEEKIQEIIARNKEAETKEIQKRRAKQIELQNREAMKRGGSALKSGGNFGSGSGSYSPTTSSSQRSSIPEPSVSSSYGDSFGKKAQAAPAAKGMQLGRKTKTSDMFEAIKSETNLDDSVSPMSSVGAPAQVTNANMESVHINITENIVVVANRDGGIQNMEVKGDLTLQVSDPEKAKIRLIVSSTQDPNLQFKTHPKVNKALFSSDNTITLKDPTQSFPLNAPTGVVRWRYVTTDEAAIPVSITCWPTPAGDGSCDVNIEYELENPSLEFTNATISIPIPAGIHPQVGDIQGEYTVDHERHTLDWHIVAIDQDHKTGALEFNAPGCTDVNSFFPVTFNFACNHTITGIDVTEVLSVESGLPVTYSKDVSLFPEEYSVV